MFSRRRHKRERFLLGVVRFRRLLENARRFMDLVEDGREKSGGDYILDRQYIVALVDGAVELIGKLVFDARVLLPGEGEPLYEAYDGCKAAARRLLAPAAHQEDAAVQPQGRDEEWAASLESRLLLDAVRWLEGPAASGEPAPMGLLDKVLDHGIRGLEPLLAFARPERSMNPITPRSRSRLDVVDLEGLEEWIDEKDRTIDSLRNTPLRLMLAGARGADAGGEASADGWPRSWLAAISDHQLSLFGAGGASRVVVEASIYGQPSADFVFIHAQGMAPARTTAAAGSRLRTTDLGHHAWSRDLPLKELEDELIRLGAAIWA